MTSIVIRGDARQLPLPDGSVDLIVTSPPYFGLRSYTDGGEHYQGQIGSESTPAEWLAALLACTREWVRVLKPSGSLFVNLGDKYAGSRMDGSSGWESAPLDHDPKHLKLGRLATEQGVLRTTAGIPAKSLLGLPWRYALAVCDQLGLILRAEIIWAKPNGLPESVTDRVRRAHEQVFHFTRQPRYYSAVDEIREPHAEVSIKRAMPHRADPGRSAREGLPYGEVLPPQTLNLAQMNHPLGKLPGSVWTIPSQPLTVPPELGVDHFAAFPMELPRRIILGWSPPGICCACDEGRRPVPYVGKTYAPRPGLLTALTRAHGADGREGARPSSIAAITGYACGCIDLPGPAEQPEVIRPDGGNERRARELPPTRPAVVLDPFGGTGTTALLASALGRTGISIDMSADYSRLARWRTTDPGERARALQVDRPPVQVAGQLDMFGDVS